MRDRQDLKINQNGLVVTFRKSHKAPFHTIAKHPHQPPPLPHLLYHHHLAILTLLVVRPPHLLIVTHGHALLYSYQSLAWNGRGHKLLNLSTCFDRLHLFLHASIYIPVIYRRTFGKRWTLMDERRTCCSCEGKSEGVRDESDESHWLPLSLPPTPSHRSCNRNRSPQQCWASALTACSAIST